MPSSPDSDAAEPIAISLTLHHSPPPTSSHLGKKSSQVLTDYISPPAHTRAHSHSQSTLRRSSNFTNDTNASKVAAKFCASQIEECGHDWQLKYRVESGSPWAS